MGMEFRVLLVWKRVWKMTFFLVWNRVKNLGNRAAHPHQEFPGVPPPTGFQVCICSVILLYKSEEKFLTRASVLFSRKFWCNLKSYES